MAKRRTGVGKRGRTHSKKTQKRIALKDEALVKRAFKRHK